MKIKKEKMHNLFNFEIFLLLIIISLIVFSSNIYSPKQKDSSAGSAITGAQIATNFPGWDKINTVYYTASQDDTVNKFMKQAADELKLHLEQVAGKTFNIITDNVALGKRNITNSTAISSAPLSALTDGITTTTPYIQVGSGLRWIQLDLEKIFSVSRVNLRHYYADNRTYRDVVVQLSEDGNNWATVFNNDNDNSIGLGVGIDSPYQETAGGKDIVLPVPVNARYVRCWSNGSNVDTANHYVELEAYDPSVLTAGQIGIYLKVDPSLPELSSKNREAFKLFTDDNGIHIIGKYPIAVRHGAYTLLEKLGFRWFFSHPAWHVTPDSLPQVELNEVQEPNFVYREIKIAVGHLVGSQAGSANYKMWQRRNRMIGNALYDVRHSWPDFANKYDVVKQDPTAVCYKADGTPQQVLPDHPVVIDRAKNYARSYFATEKSTHGYIGDVLPKISAPISPPDGNYIWCDEWRVDGKYDSQVITDKVFGLTNEVAKMLQDEFPGKLAGVYSYSWYSEIPSYKLEPNVYVQVTDFSRGTSLSTRQRLQGFKEMGVTTGFYGYFDVWPWWKDRIDPPGKYQVFLQDIRDTVETNTDTFYVEGSDNWGPKGRLYWLVAQLTWNPNRSVESLLDDFYAKAFGSAKEQMKRYYDRFDTQPHTDRVYGLAFRDIDEALNVTSAQPEIQERIRHVLYHTYFWWKWGDNIKAGYKNFDSIEEAKEFYRFLFRIRDLQIITVRLQEESLRYVLKNTYGLPDEEIRALAGLTGNTCAFDREYVPCTTKYPSTPPSPAEAQAWLDEALAAWAGQDLIDANVIDVSKITLVPAGSTIPPIQDYYYKNYYNRYLGWGGTKIIVLSSGNELITMKLWITNSGPGPMKVQWFDPNGQLLSEKQISWTDCGGYYLPNGCEWTVSTTQPGLYTLVGSGHEHWAVNISKPSAHDISKGASTAGVRTGYFYVPGGTPSMIFGVGRGHETSYVKLTDPKGVEYVLNDVEKGFRNPPSGFWKFWTSTSINENYNSVSRSIWILGISPLAWHDPKYLLVPADATGAVGVGNVSVVCGDGICSLGEKLVCSDDCVFVKGNLSDVVTNLLGVRLRVNGSEDVYKSFSERLPVEFVEVKNDSELSRVRFDFGFDLGKWLMLSRLKILKQQATDKKGYLLVSGLNLTTEKKSILIDKININSTAVCVKDAEVSDVGEVSVACNGFKEFLVSCDGKDYSGYVCKAQNGFFNVSGLSNSAVVEYIESCGNGRCGFGEGCSICPQDCGVCYRTFVKVEGEVREGAEFAFRKVFEVVLVLFVFLLLIEVVHKFRKKLKKGDKK